MKKLFTILCLFLSVLASGQGFFWSYNGTVVPVVTTQAVTSIGATTATGNGTVVQRGNPPFTDRGSCWNTSTNPTVSNSRTSDGNTVGSFTSAMYPFTLGTTYYVRAYVITPIANYYGDNVTFVPYTTATVVTTKPTSITSTSATSGGNVTTDNYSTVTDRGVCWNTSTNPTTANSHTHDGSGTGSYSSSLTSLSNNTTYYVRAWATNGAGTSYGDNYTFVASDAKTGYGKLYNFYAISGTGDNSITASGWHVPTKIEIDTLVNRLGGTSTAGGHLKQAGTSNWTSPNTGADNSSGFTALPSGRRSYSGGTFNYVLEQFYMWSATTYVTNGAYIIRARYDYANVLTGSAYYADYKNGCSVRLVCDSSTDPGSYTGNDGKTYSTVKIGNQVWTVENLKETKYRGGTTIPEVTGWSDWTTLTTGAFCWYNNNSGYE